MPYSLKYANSAEGHSYCKGSSHTEIHLGKSNW